MFWFRNLYKIEQFLKASRITVAGEMSFLLLGSGRYSTYRSPMTTLLRGSLLDAFLDQTRQGRGLNGGRRRIFTFEFSPDRFSSTTV
jgi:hypothetical protein